MRILLIEDEFALGDAMRAKLTGAGHAVDWVRALDQAAEAVLSKTHDIVLLDLNLPDGDGLSILRVLRAERDHRPVLIITAKDQLSDRLAGLNAGADDYILKPFHLDELVARIEAVQRRYLGDPSPKVTLGHLVIDKTTRQLWANGEDVLLTGREWALIMRLADRPGAIVSKVQLEEALYDYGAETESNTVEVYVSRLRRKLGRTSITTIRGLGYRLKDR